MTQPLLSPLTDIVFLRLFEGEEGLRSLAHLLNAILGLESPIVQLQHLPREPDADRVQTFQAELDLHAQDSQGRRYNIEVQLRRQPFYPERALYYWARSYSTQLARGQDYQELRPCIGVHLLDWTTSHQEEDRHLCYQLRAHERSAALTQHLALHMIQMPLYKETLEELRDDEQRWLYFLRHAATLHEEDTHTLGEAIMSTQQRLSDLSQDKDFYAIAIKREKAERDERSWKRAVREEALEEGLEQGLKQGLDQGLAQGVAQGRLRMLREVLRLTLSAKFGVEGEGWEARLAPLTLAQLEAFHLASLHAASEEALLAALPPL